MEWAAGRRRRQTRPARDRVAAGALDVLRVGVMVLDAADRVVIANPAAGELGLVRDGSAGQLVPAVIRTLAGQVRRGGVAREVELDLPSGPRPGRLAGDVVGVRVRAVPLAAPEYPAGSVAVDASDVTELHRVARVRRDFVANVSHELKTPVGALALLAEALLEAVDDPAAARRFAERIRHESQRLSRLVSDLLELSRLQGAEPPREPALVPVDRIVAEVIDRTRTAAAAKGITVSRRGADRLAIWGDEVQLVTAVANLVENAIAYSPEEATVLVTSELAGDAVEIAVADQGIGIAPGDLDRIFERFYRADQARSRVVGGTGLGLAIVKHIAVNHGGRVDVESALGSGSTFTLRLPALGGGAAQAGEPVG